MPAFEATASPNPPPALLLGGSETGAPTPPRPPQQPLLPTAPMEHWQRVKEEMLGRRDQSPKSVSQPVVKGDASTTKAPRDDRTGVPIPNTTVWGLYSASPIPISNKMWTSAHSPNGLVKAMSHVQGCVHLTSSLSPTGCSI